MVETMEIQKGYKKTEVGIIPSDWDVKKLSEIGESIIGLTYSPSNVKSHGILVLRSSNVQNGKLAFKNNVFVDMDLPKRVIVKKNDILICVRNGSRQLIGKCALIDKETAGSAFGAFMSIYRSEFSVFAFHQFQSYTIQRQINETLGATINQITNKDLASFQIPLPPTKAEQTAIATALNDADTLITQLEKLIAKKRAIKQGAMQELLKPKEGWEVKKLGEVVNLKNGYSFKSSAYIKNGVYSIITIANVQDGYMDNANCNRISELPSDIQKHQMLSIGDLLISMTGNVGRVCRVNITNALLNQRVGKIVSIDVSPDFAFHLLNSINFLNQMINNAQGGAQGNIGKSDILGYEITMPKDKQEQTRIAQILSDMDLEIEAMEKKLDKYKMLKQGMMQNLLTGRIRLV